MVSHNHDFVFSFLVFFFGSFVCFFISRFFGISNKRSLVLYFWHTFFCFFYIYYSFEYGADAITYYNGAVKGRMDFTPGTPFIYGVNAVLVHGLGFGIISSFLFFNLLGSIGLLAFDGVLKQAVKNKSNYIKSLANIIVFLPSISFWSSAIGKDAISFLAMGLALWAALNLHKRVGLMLFAILLMLFVRPHIAGMIVIALAVSVMFDPKASMIKRVFLGTLAFAGVIVMVPFALQYAGVSDPSSAESLMEYVEKRQSYNMDGGGGVDIASMSLPMQLFTYMFRPIIFEARSITAMAAALDNLILLYLFIAGGLALIKKRKRNFTENRKFMWAYAGLAWLVLAMTTANLGIAVRQKWMFAPFLIFLLISLIGKEKRSPSTIAAQQVMPRYRVK